MTEVQPLAAPPAFDTEELWESIAEMLDALLETSPQMMQITGEEDGNALEGVVEILGASPTLVRVQCELGLGRRLAFGYGLVDDDGVPQLGDAVEAFSEFVNLMGGALKLLIEAETSLGIPSVELIQLQDAGGEDFVIVDHTLGALAVQLVPH